MLPDSLAICRVLCSSSSLSFPPVSDGCSRDHWLLSQSRAPWYTHYFTGRRLREREPEYRVGWEEQHQGRKQWRKAEWNEEKGREKQNGKRGWKSSRRNRTDTFRLQRCKSRGFQHICSPTNLIYIGWMRSWPTGQCISKTGRKPQKTLSSHITLIVAVNKSGMQIMTSKHTSYHSVFWDPLHTGSKATRLADV